MAKFFRYALSHKTLAKEKVTLTGLLNSNNIPDLLRLKVCDLLSYFYPDIPGLLLILPLKIMLRSM